MMPKKGGELGCLVWVFLKTLTECQHTKEVFSWTTSFNCQQLQEIKAIISMIGARTLGLSEVKTHTPRQVDQAVYSTNMSFPHTTLPQEARGGWSQAQLLSLQHGNQDEWK